MEGGAEFSLDDDGAGHVDQNGACDESGQRLHCSQGRRKLVVKIFVRTGDKTQLPFRYECIFFIEI